MNLDEKLQNVLHKYDSFKQEKSFEERFRKINKIPDKLTKEVIVFPDKKSEAFNSSLKLIPLTDAHLGSKQCNIAKLKAMIDLIDDTENCYTILLGDMAETATKKSVGLSVYDEEFSTKEQLQVLYELLKPLADKGKILGVLTGNHEMRVAYATSINPMEILANGLGVKYLGYQAYLVLRVGSQNYSVMAHHGTSSSSTPAGKLNAMRKLNRVALADLYLSGHVHKNLYDSDVLMMPDIEKEQVISFTRHYAIAGSFLDYWGGYGEMKLLSPASTGSMLFEFRPDVKDIKVRY